MTKMMVVNKQFLKDIYGTSMLFISEEDAKKHVAEFYQSLINDMA